MTSILFETVCSQVVEHCIFSFLDLWILRQLNRYFSTKSLQEMKRQFDLLPRVCISGQHSGQNCLRHRACHTKRSCSSFAYVPIFASDRHTKAVACPCHANTVQYTNGMNRIKAAPSQSLESYAIPWIEMVCTLTCLPTVFGKARAQDYKKREAARAWLAGLLIPEPVHHKKKHIVPYTVPVALLSIQQQQQQPINSTSVASERSTKANYLLSRHHGVPTTSIVPFKSRPMSSNSSFSVSSSDTSSPTTDIKNL